MKQIVFSSVISNPNTGVKPHRKLCSIWLRNLCPRIHRLIAAVHDKMDTIQANILLKEVKEVRSLQDLARRADFLPIIQVTKGFRWPRD